MDARRILESFRAMPENWDSYHALTPTRLAVDKAKAMIPYLSDVMHPFPSVNGGVYLESNRGPDFHIEICPDGKIGSVFWMADKDSSEFLTPEPE